MRLLIPQAQFYKARYNTLIPVECKTCKRKYRKKKKFVLKILHGKLKKICKYCSEKQRVNKPSSTRSSTEVFLCNLIIRDFPRAEIIFNDRKTLPSKLELDIYLPQAKLAIEVNGIFHYENIHGDDRLAKVQKRDLAKKEETKSLGIHLLIIDTHTIKTKYMKWYIKEQYVNLVKPILNECFEPPAVPSQGSIFYLLPPGA